MLPQNEIDELMKDEAVGKTDTLEILTSTNEDSNDRAVSLNAVKETLCSMCDEWRCNENCSKKREFDKLPSVGKEINVSTTDCISRQAVFAQLVAGLEVAE